jgi:hypothetical protein
LISFIQNGPTRDSTTASEKSSQKNIVRLREHKFLKIAFRSDCKIAEGLILKRKIWLPETTRLLVQKSMWLLANSRLFNKLYWDRNWRFILWVYWFVQKCLLIIFILIKNSYKFWIILLKSWFANFKIPLNS